MNRRDFVKTSMAALFLPSLIVRPKLDLHRIVAGFCDSEGVTSRYDLSLPFVQNRTAFGTDGRIMAWIPTVDSDTSKDTGEGKEDRSHLQGREGRRRRPAGVRYPGQVRSGRG